LAYEQSLTNILTLGYDKSSSTDEQVTVAKALRALRIKSSIIDGANVPNNTWQKANIDTTKLAALTLASTHADTAVIENILDATTFVNTGASSNYALDTTAKTLKVQTAGTPAVVITVANTSITTHNYVVFKATGTNGTTGSITHYISRDAGVTFKQIYPGRGTYIGNLPSTGSIVRKVVIT
jgi:hypothetical protein